MGQKGRKHKLSDTMEKHMTNDEKEQKKETEILASDGYKMLQITPPNIIIGIKKTYYKYVSVILA